MKIKNNKIIQMLGIFVVVMIVCLAANYNGEIDNYNTTILSLNYSYGFISRGFVGTIFFIAAKVFPFIGMDAVGALRFYQISTLVFFVICFVFFGIFLKKNIKKDFNSIAYFLLILSIVIFTTFSNEFNFGRIDMYMISIALISTLLIVYEKAVLLVIPLSIIGTLMHQGFVMMYLDIILVLLVYKFFSLDNKKKKIIYAVVFVISLFASSVLFLYLELFSHTSNGEEIYASVAAIASGLSFSGTFHETLLAHEILGVDLSEVEHSMHMKNLAEIIIFILLLLPYIVMLIKIFVNTIKLSETFIDKLKYIIVLVGSLTMLPDYLIKVDYGRWVLSTTVYYIVVIVVLLSVDNNFQIAFDKEICCIKEKIVMWQLFLIYPALFVPFFDVNINQITGIIGHVLNRELLHWW